MNLSIRLRILLLALLALAGMIALLYVEYGRHQEIISISESYLERVEQVRGSLSLVHALQNERALSAGWLLYQGAELTANLAAQRQETDRQLLAYDKQSSISQTSLKGLRARLDAGQTQWPEARSSYGQWVHDLLEASKINVQQRALGISSLSLLALSDLALTAEYMDRNRSALYLAYLNGHLDDRERAALAGDWALYQDQLDRFLRLAPPELRARVAADLSEGNQQKIAAQIQKTLQDPDSIQNGHPVLWWDQSTLAVEQLQMLLDQGILLLREGIQKEVILNQERLTNYMTVAVTLLSLAVVLVSLTIGRILKALGVMLKTMSEVIDTQNFKLRVNEAHRSDEFGVIGDSINELLTYTDRLIEQKDYLASHDLLTGLLNRRKLQEMAKMEFARDDRYGQGVALVMCDLDFFKRVNDTHGHHVGDQVLEAFAQVMEAGTRSTDVACRWGGEEFLLLAPGIDEQGARQFCEKLRKMVAELKIGPVEQVTASFGVALRRKGESLDELAERADQALYDAKANGRNCVKVSHNPPEAAAPEGQRGAEPAPA
ncbi:MAG: diguanylate cyclase [bacterium]|nr:diguanylate cyclase [bacterium]